MSTHCEKTGGTSHPQPREQASRRVTGRDRQPSGSHRIRPAAPALADRLARAERELVTLQPDEIPVDASKVTAMLPRVMDAFRAMVANLGDLARRDVVKARTEVLRLVGEITLQPENGVLIAEIKRTRVAGAPITAAGGRHETGMVAG